MCPASFSFSGLDGAELRSPFSRDTYKNIHPNISKHEINKIKDTQLLGDCIEFRTRNKVKFVFRRPLFQLSGFKGLVGSSGKRLSEHLLNTGNM